MNKEKNEHLTMRYEKQIEKLIQNSKLGENNEFKKKSPKHVEIKDKL